MLLLSLASIFFKNLKFNFLNQSEITNLVYHFSSYFLGLFYKSDLNQIQKLLFVHQVVIPRKKVTNCGGSMFKIFFVTFSMISSFETLVFQFFRTLEAYFPFMTLINSKKFPLWVLWLYPEKNITSQLPCNF